MKNKKPGVVALLCSKRYWYIYCSLCQSLALSLITKYILNLLNKQLIRIHYMKLTFVSYINNLVFVLLLQINIFSLCVLSFNCLLNQYIHIYKNTLWLPSSSVGFKIGLCAYIFYLLYYPSYHYLPNVCIKYNSYTWPSYHYLHIIYIYFCICEGMSRTCKKSAL